MRGKQINLHQNYPVDCFAEHFHFFHWGFVAERRSVCHTSFVKLNTFLVICLGKGGLVHGMWTSMPNPAAGNTVASKQWAQAAFDGGCLVLSGTVGPDWFNTQHQLLCVCVFVIVSPRLRTQKNLHTESTAVSVLNISMKGWVSVRFPSDRRSAYSSEQHLSQALGQQKVKIIEVYFNLLSC